VVRPALRRGRHGIAVDRRDVINGPLFEVIDGRCGAAVLKKVQPAGCRMPGPQANGAGTTLESPAMPQQLTLRARACRALTSRSGPVRRSDGDRAGHYPMHHRCHDDAPVGGRRCSPVFCRAQAGRAWRAGATLVGASTGLGRPAASSRDRGGLERSGSCGTTLTLSLSHGSGRGTG